MDDQLIVRPGTGCNGNTPIDGGREYHAKIVIRVLTNEVHPSRSGRHTQRVCAKGFFIHLNCLPDKSIACVHGASLRLLQGNRNATEFFGLLFRAGVIDKCPSSGLASGKVLQFVLRTVGWIELDMEVVVWILSAIHR